MTGKANKMRLIDNGNEIYENDSERGTSPNNVP
jgi:hypothetical protein